jgi:hypothetical protein
MRENERKQQEQRTRQSIRDAGARWEAEALERGLTIEQYVEHYKELQRLEQQLLTTVKKFSPDELRNLIKELKRARKKKGTAARNGHEEQH